MSEAEDKRTHELISLAWAIKMQASRKHRASDLKRYLITDLEMIEERADKLLALLAEPAVKEETA